MLSVKVEDLQASIASYLKHVDAGEEVVVTDRGRAVARLVPYGRHPSLGAEDDDLAAGQVLRRGLWELPPDFWSQPTVLDPNSIFRQSVREEREQGW